MLETKYLFSWVLLEQSPKNEPQTAKKKPRTNFSKISGGIVELYVN